MLILNRHNINKLRAAMKKTLQILLFTPYALLVLGFLHLSSYAAITPTFFINQDVNFGVILFRDGNCTMDHVTGQITDANPSIMCGDVNSGASGTSVAGEFIIVANPNKQVEIKINQLDNQGDGIIYIPRGELISDFETITITPNVKQSINSGSSGTIEIKVAGQLFITNEISPSKQFELTIEEGIEWNELP
jgi:hypothetical protein